MKKLLTALVLATYSITMFANEKYYVKEVVFPQGADSVTKIEMVSRLVPSEMQMAWQNCELTAFLHFGINTFTNREWGDGKELPTTFMPDSLDTDQWISTLKAAGFKMVILTAKHHDGFCLWPTATTKHSVASSNWREGKGDVMADLRKSCDKYGMKLGVYLSPWDRNAECYGDSPRYNDMFVAQLTELLTNYGKIDEVWFDGACGEGPNGKKQEYDWLRFRDTMRRLQPNAVLAISGDDVRWVGNEGGVGRETEWSVTPLTPKTYGFADSVNNALNLNEMSVGLGSRELIAKANRVYWWPSEVDVSIRPGWFYHENETPHSLERLANIYLQSVGRNSVLLLNIPPNKKGLIDDKDVARLMELRQWIDANFTDNKLNSLPATINTVVIEEDISKGQRVEEFEVSALVDGVWHKVAQATTIGKKRILTFDNIKAEALKLNVTASRNVPHASITGAYSITMPGEEAKTESAYTIIDDEQFKKKIKMGRNPSLRVDMQKENRIDGLRYTPNTEEGLLFKYKVEASTNGRHWKEVSTIGEFGNIEANPIAQQVVFEQPIEARYIRIICTELTGKNKLTKKAFNIDLLQKK